MNKFIELIQTDAQGNLKLYVNVSDISVLEDIGDQRSMITMKNGAEFYLNHEFDVVVKLLQGNPLVNSECGIDDAFLKKFRHENTILSESDQCIVYKPK